MLDAATTSTDDSGPDYDRLSQAVGLGPMKKQLADDRAKLDKLEPAATRVPEMRAPPLQAPPTDPMQAFGQPAMWLAVFGSLLTRQPFTSAIQSASGVLRTTQGLDAAQAKTDFERWKVESENALKMQKYVQDAYGQAINRYKADATAGTAEINTLNKAFHNTALASIFEREGVEGVEKYLAAGKKNGDLAQLHSLELTDRMQKHIDELNAMRSYDDANPQAAPQVRAAAHAAIRQGKDPDEVAGKAFSPPQEIEVDDPSSPNGKRQVLAMQNKHTYGWVTADESKTPISPAGIRKVGAAETVPPLDNDAVTYYAAQFRLTGKMPPLGMNNPVYRKQILDEVAKQAGEGGHTAAGDVANQADVHANQQALTVLGRTRANVTNFEETARKEADLAMSLAPKGGAQGGPPVMNRWIQAGRQNVAGDPDVASFHAAVTSFKNEYARIMSAPGATGGVTSDAARGEADSLINGAMTQQQLQSVMATMKRGMDNRITSINEEYDATKERIKTAGSPKRGGGDALPPAAKSQLKPGVETRFGNGQVWTLDDAGNPKQVR